MKHSRYIFFLSLCCFFGILVPVKQAVTNRLCPGRFGDKILCYVMAKWISYKRKIPLFFKPFEYSSMLRLGKKEEKFSKELLKNFKGGLLKIRNEQDAIAHAKDNVLFEPAAFFNVNGSNCKEYLLACVSDNQDFKENLQYMLQPIVPLPTIELPENKISIAVHVRKGGGYDAPLASVQYYSRNQYADKRWPLKFPPEQYYVDQIKKISSLLDNQLLFIYIFTDDRNPPELTSRIEKAVNKNNITFSCRNKDNAHNAHVIEDLYNMSRFDCFIRSRSHFGAVAQLLGNHKIIIFPQHFKWLDKKLIIDKATIIDTRKGKK